MHGDRFLPLTSGAAPTQRVERHQWVAFLGSMGLHLALLLSLPWLLQREPLPKPLEIEVQFEPEPPVPALIQRHASHTRRQHATRSVQASRPVQRTAATPPVPLQEMQVELKEVKKRKIRAGGHTIKLASSAMTAPAPDNQPGTAPQGNLGAAAAPGPTWQANAPASLPPRPAYAGRMSSIAQASPAQPGENSSPGPRFVNGGTPAVQSESPEYRHAARRGGTLASQGGAQQPSAGLDARANEARQGGWQTASAGQATAVTASPSARTAGISAFSRGEATAPGRTADGGSNRPGKEPGMALAAAPVGGGSTVATRSTGSGGGTGGSRDSGTGSSPGSGSSTSGRGGSAAVPGEHPSGGLTGTSGPGTSASATTASGNARTGPDGSGGSLGGSRQGGSEGGSSGFQQATSDGIRSSRSGPGDQRAQLAGGDAPINASFESAENTKPAMQLAATNRGSARLLDDRYTATSVKASTPTHFCEIPLMMAGLGAKPIPKGLDSIMPSSSAMGGEFPPQHLPGNQMPVYPLGALGGNLQGRVTLRAEVLTSGLVGTILLKQSSGTQMLDVAAFETVRHWRFQPAQRNGQPVVAWMTVPIEYRNPQTLNGVNP
jgi:TonB family protein